MKTQHDVWATSLMRPGRSRVLEFGFYSSTGLSVNEVSWELLLYGTRYFPESKGSENTSYTQGLLVPLHPQSLTPPSQYSDGKSQNFRQSNQDLVLFLSTLLLTVAR